jgi:hypothetical protein
MAVQQALGISRTDLQQHDLSSPGYEVIQNRVELAPEAPFVRHKHPGEEIIYVLEGSLEYHVDGRSPTSLGVVVDSGHWVAERAPDGLVAALTEFLAPYRQGGGASDAAGSGS